MSITDARTLPDHSHRPEYPTGPHCPACMALGRINPDTGTPWPTLDEHGELVLADADRRFNDRYDGLNHEDALEAAVREAYLRGRMRGHLDEVQAHKNRAAEYERAAQRLAEDTAEKIGQPGAAVAVAISRDMGLVMSYLGKAAGLREAAGTRGNE